jgi:small nuclear ribonucleoprotein (snRNP)-like protein
MINTHWKEEGQYDDHVNKSDKCRFTCDTCGDSFATRFILKHHINDKHFDGALLDSEEREKCQRPKTKGMVNMRKNTPLNLRILQDFEVATAMLKPSMLDPENNVNYYVCEVCLTTYAYKLSLIHHIKYAASKHAIYLRKKTSSESDAKVTLTEILNTSFKSSDPSSEPIKQKTDLESEKREDDNAQSIHLQPQQQLQNEGQTHETHTCDEVCKVTDVRSIRNDFSLDTSSTDIVKPTMMNNTTDEKADEHSNSDEKQTHLNKDDLDADDMQPLYTARPLLPEEYISTGLENYRGMLNEQDNTENVTDDRVTNDSSEGGNDTHSYENSSEAIMTNKNGEIAGTQAYTFTPDDVNCSGKQADMKTNETTMLTSQIIPFQNQGFKVPHRCTIPQDVSADLSPPSSASEISNSKQCGTIRQLPSDFQNCLQCCLCNGEFCINCSGLPVDTYKVLLRCKEECHSGLFWTCDKCQGLVPKLSVMLSTLESFDQHINSRLKKMEETLTVVKQKYGTNQ